MKSRVSLHAASLASLCCALVSVVGLPSAFGQLIHADFSGPVTMIAGDATLLGNDVALGSPMKLSFTYSLNLPHDGSGDSGVYLAEGGGAEGFLSVGDFSYAIPRVRLQISPDIPFGTSAYPKELLGDLVYLHSTDTPVGPFHVFMSAVILYKRGTLTSLDPLAPPPDYVLAELIIARYEGSRNVVVDSFNIYGPLEELVPVPEVSTISGFASLILVTMIALRIRGGALQRQRSAGTG